MTSGGGALTLGGTNSFTGTMTVAGTVNVATWGKTGVNGVWGNRPAGTGSPTTDYIQMTSGRINYSGPSASGASPAGLRGVNLVSGTNVINISNSATILDFNGAFNYFQFNGGTLDKTGPGTLQIGDSNVANNIFNASSRVIIDAGTLDWFGGGSMPSVSIADMITINDGATFKLSFGGGSSVPAGDGFKINGNATFLIPAATHTLNGVIANGTSGSGMLTKTGAGTLVLASSNTYSGGTNINAGILQAASAGALNSTGTISFGGGTLQYTAASSGVDYSSRMSTAASQAVNVDTNGQAVTWSGAALQQRRQPHETRRGNVDPVGASSYDGATTVSAGTLALSATSGLGNTAIAVTGAAMLGAHPANNSSINLGSTGTGSLGATLSLGAGTTYDMVDSQIGTVNLQQQSSFASPSLTLAGTTLKLEISSSGADQLASTGLASVSGTNNITLATVGGSLTPATYGLISAGSGLTGTFQFTGGGTSKLVTAGSNAYQLTLANSSTVENLIVAGAPPRGRASPMAPAPNTSWDINSTNWATSASAAVAYAEGSPVTFGDANATGGPTPTGTVVVQSTGVSPASVTFANSTLAYSLSNASGTAGIAGSTSLAVQGGGSVTLNSPNTYSGSTTISGGTLRRELIRQCHRHGQRHAERRYALKRRHRHHQRQPAGSSGNSHDAGRNRRLRHFDARRTHHEHECHT